MIIKILQFNDPHLADRPPSKRTSTYMDDIFAKLDEVSELVQIRLVDCDKAAVVCTGDLFHQKSAYRVSHLLTNRVLSWVDELGVEFLLLPGNHDIKDDNLNTISKQPIGSLLYLDNVTYLEPFKPVSWYDLVVYTIPGISKYTGHDLECIGKKAAEKGKMSMIIAHLPLILDDKKYFFDTVSFREYVNMADIMMWGHKHMPDKVTVLGKTTFINPGAISRGTLSAVDMNREPQVALITVDTDKKTVDAEYIKLLSAKPISEVYLMDMIEREDDRSESLEVFLRSLTESSVGLVTTESIIEEIRSKDLEADIKKKAIDILESV